MIVWIKKVNESYWADTELGLTKKFSFDSFLKSVEFVNKLAVLFEQLNHHGKIVIDYKEVEVFCYTHGDQKTVTETDKNLADKIDGVYDLV